jgi:hemoglobin
MMKSLLRNVVVVAAGALCITGLSAAETKTLYDRLGGMPAVQAVTDDLVNRILADQRINAWFAHASSTPANTKAYKSMLTDFICQSTGGPCKYAGPDMASAHQGRNITADAFNAVVQDLVATLQKFKVPEKEQSDLLALLGPLKSQIVQK